MRDKQGLWIYDEVARVLSELRFEREFYGDFIVSPEEELKVLGDLFRQRAASIGERVNDDLCNLVATLILEAMIAQQDCKMDCRTLLAVEELPYPFTVDDLRRLARGQTEERSHE
jgi:hypothetical protein